MSQSGGGLQRSPFKTARRGACGEDMVSLKLIKRVSKMVSVIFIIRAWIADIHIHHQPLDRLAFGPFDSLKINGRGCGLVALRRAPTTRHESAFSCVPALDEGLTACGYLSFRAGDQKGIVGRLEKVVTFSTQANL
jgi:hypothetical protein